MTINAINNKVSRIVHPISSKGKSLCNVGSSLDSSVVDHLHLGTEDILREAFILIIITIIIITTFTRVRKSQTKFISL